MGLYRWTQHELMRILKEQAVPRIVQLVEDRNEAPLKTLPRLGYELVWRVRHITFLGISWTTIADANGKPVSSQYRVCVPRDVFRI